MTIICKNTGSTKLLTISNAYNVIEETETRYIILNDRGIQKNYSKDLFSIEIPPRPIAVVAAPIAVIPPPPVVISEITVNTSFIGTKDSDNDNDDDDNNEDYDDGDFDGRLTSLVTIGIGDRIIELESLVTLDVYDSSISCGIRDVQGLDSFMSFAKRATAEIETFISGLSPRIELDSQISISQLSNDIAETLLQDFVAKFQNDTYNVGLVTVSTNINNRSSVNDEFIEVLDNISSTKVEFQNPNSSNRCAHWTIAVNE
jgi:hypothetical protein